MIEETVLNYLQKAMDVPVYMEVPADLPDQFVTLEKTGTGKTDWVKSATFAIQSWSHSGGKLEAASLNEKVKEAMDGIIDLPEISGCHLNSDYDFTDTSTKYYRYQAVFDLNHY